MKVVEHVQESSDIKVEQEEDYKIAVDEIQAEQEEIDQDETGYMQVGNNYTYAEND